MILYMENKLLCSSNAPPYIMHGSKLKKHNTWVGLLKTASYLQFLSKFLHLKNAWQVTLLLCWKTSLWSSLKQEDRVGKTAKKAKMLLQTHNAKNRPILDYKHGIITFLLNKFIKNIFCPANMSNPVSKK